ncbi:ABC transporter permease [Limnobacter humi]|uniref:Transport permease protein n=1 Tax=Limnobacter humi TaxID=1778671 RepID=A0ABT1WIF9_9BURK|nr:ABC transporter permease [Limnobacter humi]MCQ8896663.1 ABC transporter permease [Limnobacter humi]
MITAFYRAVLSRELRKLIRQRDRLAASLVRPLLWLWVIGGGLQALAGADYNIRLLPGVMAMTMLFGGMIGGLSIALDKDAGTMRLLVTAPVHPVHVLLSKTCAATIGALVQASLLGLVLVLLEGLNWALHRLGLSLTPWFGWVGQFTLPHLGLLALGTALCAFTCAALGVLCGVFSKTIDGFAVLMNFVIFPVFFFSGALYPTHGMPAAARLVAQLNPFTYGVDLLRHAWASHAEYPVAFSVWILVGSALLLLGVAHWKYRLGGAAYPLQQA